MLKLCLLEGSARSHWRWGKKKKKKRLLHRITTLDLMCPCQVIIMLVSMHEYNCTLWRYIQDFSTLMCFKGFMWTFSSWHFLYLLKEITVCSVSMNAEDINDIIPVQADGAHFLFVVMLHRSNTTIPPSAKWRGLLGPVTVVLFGYPQPGLNCYIQTFHDQNNIITAVTAFGTVALNYLHLQQRC